MIRRCWKKNCVNINRHKYSMANFPIFTTLLRHGASFFLFCSIRGLIYTFECGSGYWEEREIASRTGAECMHAPLVNQKCNEKLDRSQFRLVINSNELSSANCEHMIGWVLILLVVRASFPRQNSAGMLLKTLIAFTYLQKLFVLFFIVNNERTFHLKDEWKIDFNLL